MTTVNSLRTFLTIILIGAAVLVHGQISFSPVDTTLQLQKANNELTFSIPTVEVKFPLKREVKVLPQNNFVTIDGQIIQIMSLKFVGYNKNTKGGHLDNQKDLLDVYSKYELAYFRNKLGIEVINPNSQWVMIKSKAWLIWYFNVGKVPVPVSSTQTETQLFATTILGDKILIINAPILTGGDFTKAALIVNDMMESLRITEQ